MASATEHDENYSAYYKQQRIIKVYPTEFVIRSFLGTYPRLKTDRSELTGRRVLDLGFGDGRNMPLLADLGLEVHGVEVTEAICAQITERMVAAGVKIEARVGRNSRLPYGDAHFDHLLACNSCYYVDSGQTFSDNLKEIARVMKPGARFVHSLPMSTTFLLEGAKDLGDGHVEVTQDPYGVRVGAVLRKFDSPEEIERALSPWFTDISIGSCRDDYWGSKVHLWFVVCRRR